MIIYSYTLSGATNETLFPLIFILISVYDHCQVAEKPVWDLLTVFT